MARVDSFVLDRMAAAYQQAVSRIYIAAEASAIDAWFAHNSYLSVDDLRWRDSFWSIIRAAGVAIAEATRAYLQAQLVYTGIAAPLPDIDLDWLDSDFDNYAISPALFSRFMVSEGVVGAEAIRVAADRTSKLTSAVVRRIEQDAIEQLRDSITVTWEYVIDREDTPRFPNSQIEADQMAKDSKVPTRKVGKTLRYKRIPQAGACGWCRVVADRLYSGEAKKKSLGQWHTYCRCTWRRVTRSEAQEFEARYGDGKWKTVIEERYDESGETDG